MTERWQCTAPAGFKPHHNKQVTLPAYSITSICFSGHFEYSSQQIMLVRHFVPPGGSMVPPTEHVNKMAAMDDVQVQEEYDEFRNEDGRCLLIQGFSLVILMMCTTFFLPFSLLDAITRLKQSATRKKGRGFDGELWNSNSWLD